METDTDTNTDQHVLFSNFLSIGRLRTSLLWQVRGRVTRLSPLECGSPWRRLGDHSDQWSTLVQLFHLRGYVGRLDHVLDGQSPSDTTRTTVREGHSASNFV